MAILLVLFVVAWWVFGFAVTAKVTAGLIALALAVRGVSDFFYERRSRREMERLRAPVALQREIEKMEGLD